MNRVKGALADAQRSNLWLADKVGVTPGTVSKWCRNRIQPSLETLFKIASALDIDSRELIVSTKKIRS